MKASWYAEALYEALKNESDFHKIFARFRSVLTARGHKKLLPLIPHELEKIIDREKTKNEVVLVVADEKSKSKWAHAYDHYEKEGIIPAGTKRRDVVDESIVGGYQIRTRDLLIDSCYKKSLVELYRKITN